MRTIVKSGLMVAVAEASQRIASAQDALDLMAEAWFQGAYGGIILLKENLDERFFDLKTGLAGAVLQKFSNYRMKLAIVGDFTAYKSKSLKDFIYECNQGRLVFFKGDMEQALEALTS